MSPRKIQEYAFETLDGLANAKPRGRWSKDRFEDWQGSLRLAIKHCKEDLRREIDPQEPEADE
ncbi:hypothetical protein LCGC14_0820010 [marine sediment metagenome]|uniref:Uncharacterized protein n=1 Tax=marine sediment metagenome TaxID=412755 RepID=A0A0F9S417_9ZZZZ